MRLNVKTSDTGTEHIDWEHIDGVDDVDIQHGNLRYHRKNGNGGTFDMDTVDYFHVTASDGDD